MNKEFDAGEIEALRDGISKLFEILVEGNVLMKPKRGPGRPRKYESLSEVKELPCSGPCGRTLSTEMFNNDSKNTIRFGKRYTCKECDSDRRIIEQIDKLKAKIEKIKVKLLWVKL